MSFSLKIKSGKNEDYRKILHKHYRITNANKLSLKNIQQNTSYIYLFVEDFVSA